MGQLERPKVTVGFIPLIDCAPILFADILGLFERHGLDVEIRREASWANIRDKVALGLLDAAHMLSPMPLASTLGIDSVNVPMIAAGGLPPVAMPVRESESGRSGQPVG